MPNDTSTSKPSIPDWQRKTAISADSQTKTEEVKDNGDSDPTSSQPPNSDRAALLEQAKTFLSDPAVRDATTDRKITFLESKGLTNDEINSILGINRNADASASPSTSSETGDTTIQTKEYTASIDTSTSSAAATSTVPPSRDAPPPIITYPEFLVNASTQGKPPLMSLQSVLYTLYGAAGLGATLYGASEFLVKPMLKTLSDARHDLADTTLTNLSTLNEKLEKTVSKIPAAASTYKSGVSQEDEAEDTADDEIESITSDPTEVFHRDIATQTSPDLLNDSTNTASSANQSDKDADGNSNPHIKQIEKHTQSLTQITEHLRDFAASLTTSGEVDSAMRDRITDVQSYLDGLSYPSYTSYLNTSMYAGSIYNSSGGDASQNSSNRSRNSKEEDAISAFRTEIRGVKGALLSARNFPSGRPTGVAR